MELAAITHTTACMLTKKGTKELCKSNAGVVHNKTTCNSKVTMVFISWNNIPPDIKRSMKGDLVSRGATVNYGAANLYGLCHGVKSYIKRVS